MKNRPTCTSQCVEYMTVGLLVSRYPSADDLAYLDGVQKYWCVYVCVCVATGWDFNVIMD